MIVTFPDERLARLFTDGEGSEAYPESVVSAFLRRVRCLEAAADERVLRALKSLHFEAMRDRGHRGKHSLRLNDQWRLVVAISGQGAEKTVAIHEITNHYGD
ncbi:MAG TPA: type II toxin-antitoxin system RelE/ParE family toxin [Coriobacteriia bacterium]